MSEKLVKIKMLKNCGQYIEGQEVDVPEALAKQLCEERERNNGHGVIKFRNAISVEELEILKSIPPDMGGLTVDEARAMGIKNVVPTPQSEIDRPFHPGFVEKKDSAEGVAAKMAEDLNKNNVNKKKAS